MQRVEAKINEDLKGLRLSMPHADFLDLCVVYLFLLYERIDYLETAVAKMKNSSVEAKKIIHSIKLQISKELTNLSRGNKI